MGLNHLYVEQYIVPKVAHYAILLQTAEIF